MTNEEAVARAEKELAQSEFNLETAVQRGAPDKDIRNLVTKTSYRRYVLESIKSVHRWEKRCQELKQELADLRGRYYASEALGMHQNPHPAGHSHRERWN